MSQDRFLIAVAIISASYLLLGLFVFFIFKALYARNNKVNEKYIDKVCELSDLEQEFNVNKIAWYRWIKFDFNILASRPTTCGKYFVCRKDGKIHMETWNGSGWAYNHNEIRYYAEIINPVTLKYNKQ